MYFGQHKKLYNTNPMLVTLPKEAKASTATANVAAAFVTILAENVTISFARHHSHCKVFREGGNVTACFKKCKQLFDYQHLLLLRDIWWTNV
jgi:hypothetical protein